MSADIPTCPVVLLDYHLPIHTVLKSGMETVSTVSGPADSTIFGDKVEATNTPRSIHYEWDKSYHFSVLSLRPIMVLDSWIHVSKADRHFNET